LPEIIRRRPRNF